ncbi:MAG: AraC family transcriptional regulator [Deltaproteobacteria bacterium]
MKRETLTFYEDGVRRALTAIAASLDEAIDLTALARRAALSPLHFHHVFRGMVGETPLEVHRRLRLERAAVQLAGTDAAVTTVAFDARYETHESFTRAFRRAYALSPSELRARAREARDRCERPPQLELAARCGLHFARPDFTLSTGVVTMNATIETMPEMKVATVHHLGPYNQISEAFARLGPLAGGLIGSPGTMMVGIYHDDPEAVPAAELRSDAGLVVPATATVPAGLDTTTIPAGRYAKAIHKGPYERLGDTWAQLMGVWIPQHEERIAPTVSFEVYRNTPMDAKPDDLVTELYVPLA